MSGPRRWLQGGLLVVASLGLGCVETALLEAARGYDREHLPEPIPPPPTEGAVWTGARSSGSFLFFDRKARGIGDLVTVQIVENATAETEASTELDGSRSYSASISSNVGFTELVEQLSEKLLRRLGLDDPPVADTAPGDTLDIVSATSSSEFTGDGKTGRKGTFTAVITCRVIDVLPSGLFHIRGKRALVVNHDLQLITVEGLLRPDDLSINNTIPSTALAEAKITYDGVGVLDDKQRPGLLARLVDWVFPF